MLQSIEKLFKLICLIIHPSTSQKQSEVLHYMFTILNKFQELYLIQDSIQQTGMFTNSITLIIEYFFVINNLSSSQLGIVVILFFTLHLILVLLIIKFIFHHDQPTQTIIHNFLINYPLILTIPIMYTSFSIFLNESFFKLSSGNSNKDLCFFFSIMNLIFLTIVTVIHIYFARCETLMDDNNILKLDKSITKKIMENLLLLSIIALKSSNELQSLRVMLLIIKYLIYITSSLKWINEKNFIIIESISSVISIGIVLKLSLLDILLIALLILSILVQIQDHCLSFYITTKNQDNFTTIQIIQQCLRMGSNTKHAIILRTITNNHVCPRKTKSSDETITVCLLRKMANTKDQSNLNKNILIYCQYIANNAPLKGLIKLITIKTEDLYHKSSYANLCTLLYERVKQFQQEAQLINGKKSSNEHINYLDAESAFTTTKSNQELFPILNQALNAKIQFWSKLINGYQNIDNLLSDTLKTTEKMLKCKQLFEERFDFENLKLKNGKCTDVISMRILQMFYSGIYTNSYLSYLLEKQIEDLLKSERFKEEQSLDNVQLIENRIIILKTSLVRKRGELIDINIKQLSQFLNEKDEAIKHIKNCTQLMPNFLAQIHDNLMDNYISNGYSKLMIHGESSFYELLSGYLEPCNINLYNFYDNQQDFILNMILTKVQSKNETILFGIDGKILGFTKQFYDEAFQDQTINSRQQLSISELLIRQPLIAFYIPQIINQTQELQSQINSSSNYLLNNLKSQWIIPDNHLDALQHSAFILSQFKKKQDYSNFRSFKSQTQSRFSQNSQNTQIENYEDKDFSKDLKKLIMIQDNPIILLHPEYNQIIARSITYDNNQNSSLEIHYSLQYKTLDLKKNQFGYFQLSIKEFKKWMTTLSQVAPTTNQTTQDNYQLQSVNLISDNGLQSKSYQISNVNSEISEKLDEGLKDIRQIQYFNLSQSNFKDNNNSANQSKIQSISNSRLIVQKLGTTERAYELEYQTVGQQSLATNTRRCSSNLFLQSQFSIQPLYIQPKIFDKKISEEVNDIENEMNSIENQGQLKEQLEKIQINPINDDQEDQIDQIEVVQSNSQSEKKKLNLLEKFQKSQLRKQKENYGDFQSNPSRTSTSSTSKEALTIVQQLYDNKKLINPLKKISFLFVLICCGVFIINIINVNQIENNLLTQIDQINNVKKPLNINYFYFGALFQQICKMLHYMNILELSPHQVNRIEEQLVKMYQYGREIMFDHIVDVSILAKVIDITTFPCKIIENNERVTLNTTLHEFYTIYFELAEDLYRRNLKCSKDCDYFDLYTHGFIRQNLVIMMEFHDQLIDQITQFTLEKQNEVKGDFLQIMLAEMSVILLIVGIQLKIWLFIDQITKHIIFLISRLNEIQAMDQIQKLSLIKYYIETESNNQWKITNFSDLMFKYLENKKVQKVIIINQKESDKINNYKSTTALYSRIQKTYYINRINIILTFMLLLTWPLYLMTGYLIHMQNNNDFQPSLEVTLNMVQFRHNMDATAILAGIIKTENLLPNNDLNYINQTYIIELFLELKNNLSPIINNMATVVLDNANQNNEKSRFDDLLNNDLCLSSNSSVLVMCEPNLITLQYYDKDDYSYITKNGALGLVAGFIKFINQDFNYEFTTLHYNPNLTENYEEINTQQFNSFLISYSTDILEVMKMFLILLQEENKSIADQIMSIIQAYYLGFGISLFFIFSLTSILWIYFAQKQMNSLRQILVLIPVDLILSANIRSQAKEIHSWLYS
ncbi:unnamed protein product [Paramecium sonneborni]|uniref:Transmembrane protein n=1 Tax=Paramecium sonneborni TaxID=65129 RepID=A0A8S1PUV8_9CILI|nr:unnamed protein product [Paramecium sonneborni]